MNADRAAEKYQAFVESLDLRCVDQATIDMLMNGAAYIRKCMDDHTDVDMERAIPWYLLRFYHEEER